MFASCINNDIPYPRIQANIVSISADSEMRSAQIDTANLTATLYLPEEVDITNVLISECSLSPGATLTAGSLTGALDLSSPQTVTVHLYQDYNWTIVGSQTIERYFTVANQVGSSVIDVPGHRVICSISNKADLANIKVQSMKLGANGCTMVPELVGHTVRGTKPITVTVTEYGRESEWTIYINQTETSVTTSSVDAWTCVAWVYGEAEVGKDNGFEYRKVGDEEWTKVPEDWLTIDGGSFSARIVHLTPETQYETRAYSDSDYGETLTFTTGSIVQIPNSSFDDWWLNGKIWTPCAEGDTQYWDTGNKGATTLGNSNSVPTDDTYSGKGQAAMLETKFIGLGSIGKLAAGNVFLGQYVRTDGTNGILAFGREFTQRPTKLKGYLKYTTAPINYVASNFEYMRGQPDTCTVWMALIDTNSTFEIRTNPNNRQLFDPNGDYVVAYGITQFGRDVPEYIQFETVFDYKSTSRVPTHLIIAASASKYGDYFTGGAGAVLYVDDFELEYDY